MSSPRKYTITLLEREFKAIEAIIRAHPALWSKPSEWVHDIIREAIRAQQGR